MRIPILPTIIVVAAVATMIGLGIWQLERKEWKEALIAEARQADAPPARDFDVSVNFKRDTASLLIVRDVLYRPGWSWEVEGIREVAMDSLPVDISPLHESWIRAIRPLL